MASHPVKLAVLISGNGSNLQSIIDEIEQGKLQATIVCVISNNADAFGLKRAEKHGIASHAIDHSTFSTKADFEAAIRAVLNENPPDLIILAGFMRILSADFVNHYPNRILNIHPSLLPKYKGLDTYQRVLDSGDAEHGATVHLVTDELDSGEIILQQSYSIEEDDTIQILQQKTHNIEHVIYPEAIRQYSQKLEA